MPAPFNRVAGLSSLRGRGLLDLQPARASLENSIASTSILSFSSYEEPTVDALAPEAEEGRGRLR